MKMAAPIQNGSTAGASQAPAKGRLAAKLHHDTEIRAPHEIQEVLVAGPSHIFRVALNARWLHTGHVNM